jgi:hypothetical protein
MHVTYQRFELGEPIIATDAYYAYAYAHYVLNGRFELGELVIATNLDCAYHYARNVLEGKFEAGEQVILKSNYAENYKLSLRPRQ